MYVWVYVFIAKFSYTYCVSEIYIAYERQQRIIYVSNDEEGFNNDRRSQGKGGLVAK